VTTLIGAGNAAGLFPLIAPAPEGVASTVVGAGSATGLFPQITPPATPSPAPGGLPQAAGSSTGRVGAAVRAADASATPPGRQVLTDQVLGLIALALAILLAITRLSVRGRTGPRGHGEH
jgi:hypothetical protein